MDQRNLRLITTVPKPNLSLEPEAEVFLESLNWNEQFHMITPQQVRTLLEKIQGPPHFRPDIRIENLKIDAGPHGTVPVQIFRRNSIPKNVPILLYFHGGAGMAGNEKTHHRLLVDLVREVDMALVFVKYTPSPETVFPTALEQCYATANYFFHHGSRHNLDSHRMAVAGDGMGGNLATILARWSLERKGPPFLFQILFYPVTDAAMTSESYDIYQEGPWLTRTAMREFWSHYEPFADRRLDSSHSPLRTELRKLRGLPPTLIITAEHDVLRDEGEAYARALVDAGVNVTAIRVLGTIHDFAMLNALSETEATRNVIDLAGTRLRAALDHSSSTEKNNG